MGFYIVLPFIYGISLLPFWIFYSLSDFVFVLLYYVVGYRKKVVYENLKNAFPEKTHAEIKRIERRFFRYLCDLILETFKTLTVSKKTMLTHCKMNEDAQKIFDSYYAQQKSIIIVMGHFGNWEWAGAVFDNSKQQLYVLYHQLSNPYFNKLIIKMRTRLGTKLIEMKSTLRDMVANRKEITATAFIADQTPFPENAYWTTFLNQDTPVFTGTEKIAQKMKFFQPGNVKFSVRKHLQIGDAMSNHTIHQPELLHYGLKRHPSAKIERKAGQPQAGMPCFVPLIDVYPNEREPLK